MMSWFARVMLKILDEYQGSNGEWIPLDHFIVVVEICRCILIGSPALYMLYTTHTTSHAHSKEVILTHCEENSFLNTDVEKDYFVSFGRLEVHFCCT